MSLALQPQAFHPPDALLPHRIQGRGPGRAGQQVPRMRLVESRAPDLGPARPGEASGGSRPEALPIGPGPGPEQGGQATPGQAPDSGPRPAGASGGFKALSTAGELRRVVEDLEGLPGGKVAQAALLGGVAWAGGAAGPAIMAHELGHYAAVHAVYQNPRARIEIRPFVGGATYYRPGPLTSFGERLGPRLATALVAGAGTLVDTALSLGTFAAGYRLRRKHPLLGATLMGFAGWTMVNSVGYALTALGPTGPGNDFAALAASLGLHPLVTAGLLASILPAEYLLLRWAEKQGL